MVAYCGFEQDSIIHSLLSHSDFQLEILTRLLKSSPPTPFFTGTVRRRSQNESPFYNELKLQSAHLTLLYRNQHVLRHQQRSQALRCDKLLLMKSYERNWQSILPPVRLDWVEFADERADRPDPLYLGTCWRLSAQRCVSHSEQIERATWDHGGFWRNVIFTRPPQPVIYLFFSTAKADGKLFLCKNKDKTLPHTVQR